VIPQGYQTALVEWAKHKITIVHLGTGTGKTFIALLLIQYYLQWEEVEQGQREGEDKDNDQDSHDKKEMQGNAVMDTTNEMTNASHLHTRKLAQMVFLVPSIAFAVQQQTF